jgi:pimeloyl-ACP methyl ester carboxylesterase
MKRISGVSPERMSGHDASERRGRFDLAEVERAAVRECMAALLRLGDVQMEARIAAWPHGRIHYLMGGAGAPLVLLQGAGGGAANWYRLLFALTRQRRVYAPDLPGFGLSDPIEPAAPLGMQAARMMLEWLDEIGLHEPVDILGTSFGGLLTLRMALLAPGRIRSIMLLNACGLGRGITSAARLAALPRIGAMVRTPSRFGTDLLFRTLLTADRRQLPRQHQQAIVDYTWQTARAGAGAQIADALRVFVSWSGQREVLSDAELRSIRQPGLLLWGTADRFLPCSHARRAAQLLPDVRVQLLPGIGHSPNWEAPDVVLQHVLPFLDAQLT